MLTGFFLNRGGAEDAEILCSLGAFAVRKRNEKQKENENEWLVALTSLGLRLFAAERSRGHIITIASGARAKSRAKA